MTLFDRLRSSDSRQSFERFGDAKRMHLKSAGPSVAVEALLTPVVQSLGKRTEQTEQTNKNETERLKQ